MVPISIVPIQMYLDPSAMTYVIQAVAGVAIAGSALFVILWRKVKLRAKEGKKQQQLQKAKENQTNTVDLLEENPEIDDSVVPDFMKENDISLQ